MLEQVDPKAAQDPAVLSQRAGNLAISALRLPGNIDKLVAEVRSFHTRVTNGAVEYDPSEVLPTTKGSYKPSLYFIVVGVLILLFVSLVATSLITGMTIEQLLNKVGLRG